MYEEICYQNNYVREVVCRLDFASPINVLKNTMPKNIYDVVKKYYPIAEPQDIIGTELQINPVNGPAVNQVRTKQWVFYQEIEKINVLLNQIILYFLLKIIMCLKN